LCDLISFDRLLLSPASGGKHLLPKGQETIVTIETRSASYVTFASMLEHQPPRWVYSIAVRN